MPAPTKWDAELVKRLRSKNYTYKRIEQETGIPSASARAIMWRLGLTKPKEEIRVLPLQWGRIAAEDMDNYYLQRLRWALALDRGAQLRDDELRKTQDFVENLAVRKCVVWYSARTGPVIVPKAKGDGKYTSTASLEEINARLAERGQPPVG